MSIPVEVVITAVDDWKDSSEKLVTFRSVEPFYEAGVSEESLQKKWYRSGSATTYFVRPEGLEIALGPALLWVDTGSYAIMHYKGQPEELTVDESNRRRIEALERQVAVMKALDSTLTNTLNTFCNN